MMGYYQKWIVPALIDLSMRNKRFRPYRERVAGAAEGRVLDVGVGSGLNLPFYARQAREIFGLDPSPALLARAGGNAQHLNIPVHLLEGSAERIPLADRSMDTIVLTWTGCSISDIRTALGEMRRVLKPGGRLLFVEHETTVTGAVPFLGSLVWPLGCANAICLSSVDLGRRRRTSSF
jgi:ubiquinone/menaquinone biosynthesis C-methylase UbiE